MSVSVDGVHEERARKISVKVVHRVGFLTARALARLQSVVAIFRSLRVSDTLLRVSRLLRAMCGSEAFRGVYNR